MFGVNKKDRIGRSENKTKQNEGKMNENFKTRLHNKRIGFRNYSESCRLLRSPAKNIPIEEQELHVYVARDGFNAQICCSNQIWITKLRKNPCFIVEEILLSEANSGYILQVRGIIPANLVSLRSVPRSSPTQKEKNESLRGDSDGNA